MGIIRHRGKPCILKKLFYKSKGFILSTCRMYHVPNPATNNIKGTTVIFRLVIIATLKLTYLTYIGYKLQRNYDDWSKCCQNRAAGQCSAGYWKLMTGLARKHGIDTLRPNPSKGKLWMSKICTF